MIDDLVEFASKLHSYADLAKLQLPGFSWTRQGVFQRLRKFGVCRRPRTREGRSGFDFFDLPDFWKVAIIRHFISKPPDAHLDQKQIDKILYTAACRDERFAQEWAKREKHLDTVHKKIIDLIVACGAQRDNGF